MEKYQETSIGKIAREITKKGKKETNGKKFRIHGRPRGIISREHGPLLQITYTLHDSSENFAVVNQYVPNDGEEIYSIIKTANECSDCIYVNGMLETGINNLNVKDPVVYIFADGIQFRNFKAGSLEDKITK